MRLPHPPANATRFFGRVYSAICECPRCGCLLTWHGGKGPRRNTSGWDRRTSTITCWDCGRKFVAGLLLWPVRKGRGDVRTLPRDQVPDERQLVQMRKLGDGWWMPKEQAKKAFRPDDTNITACCTCPPGRENTTGGDPKCPIHGEGGV